MQANFGFWGGLSAGGFSDFWGFWRGSVSGLRRFSNGLVSVLPMGKGVFFQSDFLAGTASSLVFAEGLAVCFAGLTPSVLLLF